MKNNNKTNTNAKTTKTAKNNETPSKKSTASKSTAKDNRYAGHRQRVKYQFQTSGLEGFSQHRILELLLFFTIPNKDVADLARDLIDYFGSLARVLKADHNELVARKGVGDHTAILLRLIDSVASCIYKEEHENTITITSDKKAYDRLKPYFVADNREKLRILCLDGEKNVLAIRIVGEGKRLSVGLDIRRIVKEALALNAVYIYVAHGHVEGTVEPSHADWEATTELVSILHSMEIFVLDHLVIGRGDYASMRKISEVQKIPLPWSN